MAGRVLVIGATGTVGSELVRQLVQRGEKVRAATRQPAAARRGSGGTAELVEFDFERRNQFVHAGRAGKSLIIANRASAR